jgi:hypothetical protein
MGRWRSVAVRTRRAPLVVIGEGAKSADDSTDEDGRQPSLPNTEHSHLHIVTWDTDLPPQIP